MRLFALLAAAALSTQASAQSIVMSAAPDRVAVTVYRDTGRGLSPLNLQWLGGYALVSETRRVRLPAGESELRFEGVTSGIVPQSAIVTGLGTAVLEKNRDAKLLSPGALLDAYLGERLMLRRTSLANGAVREQEAIVRATTDGVVLQTANGIEALRCTGLNETLVAPAVPEDLAAKPTLSVRVRSPQPVDTEVQLSYLTNNFDWQTDYVAELSGSGDRISLFGWMTLANGDDTGLADAATQAVAGKLNYQRVHVPPGEAKPIRIQCWPQGTTSDIPLDRLAQAIGGEEIIVTGSRMAAPPPPPPPPAPERGGDDVMAQEERLGDVRLYRVPISVTVAAKSQKQIVLLRQPAVKVESILRLRPHESSYPEVQRVLVTRNRASQGLGLALPAGKVTLFGRAGERRILIGEGRIDDHAVGEKVEIAVSTSTGVRADLAQVGRGEDYHLELTLTNDLRQPRLVEVELPLGTKAAGSKLIRRDGWMLWRVSVPANGTAELSYKIGD